MKQFQLLDANITIHGIENDKYYSNLPAVVLNDDLFPFVKNYLNLRKNATYIDIGANIGVTTIALASYLKEGKVLAFEPASKAYDLLVKNVQANGLKNILTFNMGLGEEKRKSNFYTADFLAASHIAEKDYIDTNEGSHEMVTIERLDNLIDEYGIEDIDFIKIDVEGYERNVLEGCDRLIKKFNPIFFVEINAWCLIAFKNESPRIFLDYLVKKFSHVYHIRCGNITLLNNQKALNQFMHDHLVYHSCGDNLICLNGKLENRKNTSFLTSLKNYLKYK